MDIKKCIKLNEQASDMLDNIRSVLGKRKIWLKYIDTIRIIRNIFAISFSTYIIMYFILCCLFNFSPTYTYNMLMTVSFIGTIISAATLSIGFAKYDKLETKYNSLWEEYEQFKKDNNLK